VLHGAGGNRGWRQWMERVAELYTIWAPTHPGFGASGDAEWMEGIDDLALRGQIETIDWYFRFRGQLIHKVCHFYLMETTQASTNPQQAEGITACRWVSYDEARSAISYANARKVLARAHEMIVGPPAAEADVDAVQSPPRERELQLGLPLDRPVRGKGT